MQRAIKKLFSFILILVLTLQIIGDYHTIGAKSIPTTDMILYVGEKYGIDDFFNDNIHNPGKYIISNSNVVGIEGYYSKNQRDGQGWKTPDGFYSQIVALHTGKTTVNVINGSKTIYKYNITVKNRELISPSGYLELYGYVPHDYPETRIGRKIDKRKIEEESIAKEVLKSLNLESYDSDRERIYALAKWVHNFEFGEGDALSNKFYDCYKESNLGSVHVIQNMGIKTSIGGGVNEWIPDMCLDGSWYSFRFNKFHIGIENCIEGKNDLNIKYTSNTKTHLPSMIVDIETKQQNLLVGQSKSLPNDRLSHNVNSSDTSVVVIENGKLVAKGTGIAIVYRYDGTYCDAFYVVVESNIKASKKTVKLIKSGKIQKSFKRLSPYRKRIKSYKDNNEARTIASLNILEPSLSPNTKLFTTYNNETGLLAGYAVNEDGTKTLLFDDKEILD